MVLVTTAFPEFSAKDIDTLRNDQHLHKCYDCLYEATKGYFKTKAKFHTRYPDWNTLVDKSTKFAKDGETLPEWAHKTLWKYSQGHKCADECRKQEIGSPIFVIGIQRLSNREKRFAIENFL